MSARAEAARVAKRTLAALVTEMSLTVTTSRVADLRKKK